MKRLFEFLIDGCFHEWECVKTVYVYDKETDSYPIGNKYVLKCKKCGKMKTFKTYSL